MSTLATSIQYCTRCSNKRSRHENKIKNIHSGKEEVKLPLCANVMILYTENSIKKPLKSFKNKFRKVAQYKNTQKPIAFL